MDADDEDEGNVMTPKTVTWATEHEERIIENHVTQIPRPKSRPG